MGGFPLAADTPAITVVEHRVLRGNTNGRKEAQRAGLLERGQWPTLRSKPKRNPRVAGLAAAVVLMGPATKAASSRGTLLGVQFRHHAGLDGARNSSGLVLHVA